MPRGKGSKKGPFDDLPEEWRTAREQEKDSNKLLEEVSKVAVADSQLREAMGLDEDLKQKKEQASEAGRGYREGFKTNRLKTKFVVQVLASRGVPIAVNGFLTKAPAAKK